ncbi:bifunctional diguanylate cyclase/phosphodiesterase [Aromatoleum anaerobium]|uniref:EAL domain-containing protein n=1 Tax=Aromatoleum anaerobium TaxID=182180 RepID=A0ABX1PIB4_9RHOO|nr:LapD/MoxY N-terminal periplasmic domain-containing protein [Aromatoleum anaerobium]MCK0506740.1 EAL domain-containing protein [Aromatoleum anaerobium]
MSLIKQLWIAIAIVMSLSLGGSLVVSTLSARHYLEQQLQVKNLDNATSLALSLSQLPKDPVTVELQVAAQFDAGHYRLIRLTGPSGDVVVEREYADPHNGTPDWFTRLIPIEARPGIAQVQDGWHQFGTLTLESHKRYAYEALWVGTKQLLLWFGLGGALTGLIGTLLIKHITRPLGRVVEQAEAIGERRFVTTPEPGTMEFRRLVRAMNTLSERVRTMLADESRRLEQLRRQTQHDDITGLLNRGQFMNRLDSVLARDDARSAGTLLIARLGDLAALNQRLGRDTTNRLLREIAGQYAAFAAPHADWETGRIGGSDFALLAPGCPDPAAIAGELAQRLDTALNVTAEGRGIRLPLAAGAFAAGESRSSLLARVDGALAVAERAGERAMEIAKESITAMPFPDLQAWRTALTEALDRNDIRLARFPVFGADGTLLHDEAPMRLMLDGTWRAAGYFMPWAARLGLAARFDAAVARAAVREIATSATPLGINISAESLADASFRSELFSLLQGNPAAAQRLWIEVPEYGALRHQPEFRAFCLALRPFGCKLGIEHAGPRFARLNDLHELGLDYIKIDAAIIRGIDGDASSQGFLRSLCTIAHSIGLLTIAEGVGTEAEKRALPAFGVDGMTGPAIKAPQRLQPSHAPDAAWP